MKPAKKTLRILGYELTLETGRRYRAVRPALLGRMEGEQVLVRIVEGERRFGPVVVDVAMMPLEEADAFLAEFNNGENSFEGRAW